MKLKWKMSCFILIFIIDVILCRQLVYFFSLSRETVFSPEQVVSKKETKMIALTFDDGPDPKFTPVLLDGLKKRGVKVSFFLLGENMEGNEAIVLQMKEDGHLIGNHGYSHIQMGKVKPEEACRQISETNEKIKEITGQVPEYIRPPYGEWSEELDCMVPMTVALWNLDSKDWSLQNSTQIVNQVMKKACNADIILMHDIFPSSVEAALEIIDRLQAEGYVFVTVDELLID